MKMRFKKVRDKGNFIGFDVIEILQFNYDSTGSAITLADGELQSFSSDDLDYIIFGDPQSGDKAYELLELE